MRERKSVFISSTSLDLPEHRKQAIEACQRMSMFPIAMEFLTVSDDDAVKASLRMCDEADIYVGIFAYRYGYVPTGYDISVTEMEYNRAKERGIPRLIFIMHDDHPIKGSDVEKGEGAVRLEAFKKRIGAENIVAFFTSPEDLRAHLIQGLAPHREAQTSLHFVQPIPAPPIPYIAHPYTLLPSEQMQGRAAEINLLTDWVAKPSSAVYRARMLNIVAIGGMGKSALTWKWFNHIAQEEMKPLAGRFWWSFYESDAHFENFIIRALAYVSGQPIDAIRQLAPHDRETQLLNILDKQPFLLVLDGLERILTAYARMDAAHLSDDDLDQQTANRVAGALGLPESAGQSFIGQHRLRRTADPRAGHFLQKLAQVKAARILVTTRLYPADVQLPTGQPAYGCDAIFLYGLKDDDALNLWRSYGVGGGRDELLTIFRSVDNYPLLIRALAGEVAGFRRAPGDFTAWRAANPDFNPAALPLIQRKSHVLQYALLELSDAAYTVLHTVTAFRMPATYDALAALLVNDKNATDEKMGPPPSPLERQNLIARWFNRLRGQEPTPPPPQTQPIQAAKKLCTDENQLDAILLELEDRGLIGWDRRANRYDLHPIVRGVTWDKLPAERKQAVYAGLQGYFEAVPTKEFDEVESLDDLTPAIELYNALVGLGRYDEAFIVFRDRIFQATHYRLSAQRQNLELLKRLFPDGENNLPRLQGESDQAWALIVLAIAYHASGQPGQAVPLYRREIAMREAQNDLRNASITLGNLSNAARLSGGVYTAEASACRALLITREQKNAFQEAISLYWLGLALGLRGELQAGETALRRSLRIRESDKNVQGQGLVNASLVQVALWRAGASSATHPRDVFAAARRLAERAWELAQVQRLEGDFIRAARLVGAAALGMGDFAVADERLHHALERARKVSYMEEELPALVGLAELARQQGQPALARERLSEMWELAEAGPYPLFHADGLNLLAHIERDAGNLAAAVEAATRAYQLAWCDGISSDGQHRYAYHPGLEAAKAHLSALGVPIPAMPPFDPSKFEPMVEVEINPPDEFGGEG